jgi:hypothetical protein
MLKPLAKLLSMLTPKRRWAQFSLGTMFVVVTVLCVWLGVVVNRAHRQRDSVAATDAGLAHLKKLTGLLTSIPLDLLVPDLSARMNPRREATLFAALRACNQPTRASLPR